MSKKTGASAARRAGFVAIVGEANVGKSTLLNQILGVKLSIVSKKPQTTRKRVLGIHSDDNVQMVFMDTPGILTPRYELHRSMMEYVRDAIETADVILLLLDASQAINSLEYVENKLKIALAEMPRPVVIGLNKVDRVHLKKSILPIMQELLAVQTVREVVPISALAGDNVAALLSAVQKHVPEHEFYYDPEDLSELPQRFFVAEMIRETVFREFRQEIPYSTEIVINEFKERETGKLYINADIVVERDTQKAIVIGKGGSKLKELGQRSRKAIEAHLGMPIYLELFVKVREDWRDNKNHLQSFGY